MPGKLLSFSFGAVACAAVLIGHPTTTRAQDLSCSGPGSITGPITGPGGGADPNCAFATINGDDLDLGVTFSSGFSSTLSNVEFELATSVGTYLVIFGSSYEGDGAPAYYFAPPAPTLFTGDGTTDYFDNGLEATISIADIGDNDPTSFTVFTTTELALNENEYDPDQYVVGPGTPAVVESTTSVPEPTSLVLLASGLATLTALRRRARKARS